MTIIQLIEEADRCVKCALCLPHCPTYQLVKNEAASPRGRIALMQAWLQDELPSNAQLYQHLDSCLMCRSCEGACPSGVKYGVLMDGVRRHRWQSWGRLARLRSRLLLMLLSNRRLPIVVRPLLHLYQMSSVSTLFRGWLPSWLKRVESMLPQLTAIKAIQPNYPTTQTQKRRVILFTGCISQLVEREVHQAAITLLNHLGCDVVIPDSQCCCGAMHRHAGDSSAAARLMVQNRAHLSDESFDALLFMASGCGAELAEQGGFSQPVRDISDYLLQLDWPDDLELQPLNARVVIHEPCSMFYGRFDRQAVPLLLQKIPQLQTVMFNNAPLCCGAAGSYMLTQSEMSHQLQRLKVEAVKKLQPDILVTTNTGCALQLRSGLREAGLNVEVLHPLQLIARQLSVT
ncbi:MAG: (Fe-S)-binding protein [Candidatus Polarisedimenticolaceae bacterium]|nr:(Fe-S)-binding protein [Candidatus Polarisedimenticolaceae bacterium]